jgi:hypothetical protein
MLAQHVGLPALAALLAAGAGTGTPVTAKYRIDQTLTQEIDATAAGKGKQSLSFTTSSFLTLTLTDSIGGRAVRVVVDSMRADSTAPIPSTVFDSARGAEYHGFLSATGRLSELEIVSSSAAAAQVQGFLADFFPWVKAGVKVGEHWADTTAKTTTNGADSVVVKRIVAYQAMGNETRNARKAVRIASQYNSNVLGTQPTPNGPAKIEGTGSGTGIYFVTPDGSYLGGDWQLRSALKISGSFANDPLPITITQSTKVTALK